MLAGKRIMLREFEEEDWKAVHKYASQEIVSQYQPWGPNTEKDSIAYVNEAINESKNNPRVRFAFAIVENRSGEMIGAGELCIRSSANREGEIGYVIHPGYWGFGYATETANILINFGFSTLKLHRIFATCDPRNKASEKVLKKISMTLEGRLRESIRLKDGWRDSLLFSMLEQEWSLKKGLD
ncbi:GNAT family N-acetyltransferase [Fictibacillus arsenicus]|uniref:GNAT family N-acetyltransferase n=1 Tax=Fictibacillus arsenicus TaxID=255247 RepID=A0A1V3G8R9_9BACL|nr:GNAT family protein [Fictibacillus arsenicus]OOE12799.1 GNAT family N-acetyltransferase [Fictibacillus arsenicus]